MDLDYPRFVHFIKVYSFCLLLFTFSTFSPGGKLTEDEMFFKYISEKNVLNATMVYDNHSKSVLLSMENIEAYVNLLFENMVSFLFKFMYDIV